MSREEIIKNNKLEKPWCTYGNGYPCWGYGFIISESSLSVDILYSESQIYPPECWGNKPEYIKRFKTLEEAAKQYMDEHNSGYDLRMDHPITNDELLSDMRYKFPTYFKIKEEKKEQK